MRAVVQRVKRGAVSIAGKDVAAIGQGLVVLVGVGKEDEKEDAAYLAEKICNLRIFEDEAGKMNLSVLDTGGSILAVSQFTLYGDCRKGRRPGFSEAALPEEAEMLYKCFLSAMENQGVPVAAGIFREHMLVRIENDGPVTLLLDSGKAF